MCDVHEHLLYRDAHFSTCVVCSIASYVWHITESDAPQNYTLEPPHVEINTIVANRFGRVSCARNFCTVSVAMNYTREHDTLDMDAFLNIFGRIWVIYEALGNICHRTFNYYVDYAWLCRSYY